MIEMTIEEKRDIVRDYCIETVCEHCVISGDWCDGNSISKCSESALDEAIAMIKGVGSNVNHPTHYNREGALECIDEMVLVFGKEATMNFCLLNAWKYRYRAADKNGEEDLKKSDWYLKKVKELGGE